MTVEGNWIIGAMQSTYPKINYEVVPMPVGPGGHHGTLVFTNCWGIAASSKYTAADVSFVKYLASPAQQLKFANAFGVMPSRPSVATQWAARAHHASGSVAPPGPRTCPLSSRATPTLCPRWQPSASHRCRARSNRRYSGCPTGRPTPSKCSSSCRLTPRRCCSPSAQVHRRCRPANQGLAPPGLRLPRVSSLAGPGNNPYDLHKRPFTKTPFTKSQCLAK